MALRLIQHLCFMLFVMVLPSQAMACLSKIETENESPLSDAALSTGQATHLSEECLFPTPLSHTPISNSHSHADTSAPVIAVHRGLWQGRQMLSDESNSSDGHRSYPAAFSTYEYESGVHLNIAYFFSVPLFYQPHRLAGWKETNALYVALNSQFRGEQGQIV